MNGHGLQKFLPVVVLALAQTPAWAAGLTIENHDRNKDIRVYDAYAEGSDTTLLYATLPMIDQGHASEDCSANFYLLELRPGLPTAQPQMLAENYCRYFGMTGTLLANGDVRIIAGGRVDTWRPGAGKVGSWRISDTDALKGLWNEHNDGGNTPLDAARDGDMVIGKIYGRQRNDTKTASGLVARLAPDGKTRWQVELEEPGVLLNVQDVWATADGGALVHIAATPMSGAHLPGTEAAAGAVITGQKRLYRVSAGGDLSAPLVLASNQMRDFSAPQQPMPDFNEDPEAFQAALQAAIGGQQELMQGESYGYGAVRAHPQADGGVDLLLGHDSKKARFVRVSRNGSLLLDASLDEAITNEGLGNWIDFLSSEDQVILFGALGTRENRLAQGYLSWIVIAQGDVVTRLAPLHELGLEAARSAGDEEIQYLEHNPSQQPQLLSSVAGQPLMVSLIYRSRRLAIQIDEGTRQLLLYTEARDERQAASAKEVQRVERKASREAMNQEMNVDMAAAIGVSPEEYAAMSNKERKEAMVRRGDMDAMMAAAMKQAEKAQQQMAAQQSTQQQAMPAASGPQSMPPGMTPEMMAEMMAAKAQVQQAMADAGMAMPDIPGTPATGTSSLPATAETDAADVSTSSGESAKPAGADTELLPLDENMRGYVEFEHPDGYSLTLIIFNRQSGKELLRKDYEDGSIYEYIDFSRYQLPLNQIGVKYLDDDGQILGELTPAVTG